MKNFIQPGETLTLTAPYTVSSGGGALVGGIFGVAVKDVTSGASGEFKTEGVFELATTDTSTAWTVGQDLFWDAVNKTATCVPGLGILIGQATEAKGSTAAVGKVRLVPKSQTFPRVPFDAAVSAQAATATLTTAAAGKNVTNTGASGTIQLTLPAASTMTNKSFRVQVTVAQIVQLVPATGEKIYLGGSGAASKYLQIAGVIGNHAEIFCNGTDYGVIESSGVLTKEA